MALRRTPRLVAACAGIAVGVVAVALARRRTAPSADPARAIYLEARRARMQSARSELIATRNGTSA
jgi:hypothetical protein